MAAHNIHGEHEAAMSLHFELELFKWLLHLFRL